jgi:hypothetical protein
MNPAACPPSTWAQAACVHAKQNRMVKALFVSPTLIIRQETLFIIGIGGLKDF